MLIVGVLATGALYLIGVPGALFLGILAGVLEFVPLVGPIVAAVPPLLFAFVSGRPLDILWVLLVYLAIQQIESNLLEPLVMEEAVSLHPAAVLVAVAVIGTAFGLLGTILAVPAAVVSSIFVEKLWFYGSNGSKTGISTWAKTRKEITAECLTNPWRQDTL